MIVQFYVLSDPALVPESTFSIVTKLIGVLVWPSVLSIVLLSQRKAIRRVLLAFTSLAESANKIKVWQVEVEKEIKQEVSNAGETAKLESPSKTQISKQTITAATRVESLIFAGSGLIQQAEIARFGTSTDAPIEQRIRQY